MADRKFYIVHLQPHHKRELQNEEKNNYRLQGSDLTSEEKLQRRAWLDIANRHILGITGLLIVSDDHYYDNAHIYLQCIGGNSDDETRCDSVEEAMNIAEEYWGVSPDEWEPCGQS